MNSVTTRFNPRPQPPRFTAEKNIDVLEFCQQYEAKTQSFYRTLESKTKSIIFKYVMMDSALALKF